MTRLPFSSWCPACMLGKSRARMHKMATIMANKVLEIVFDDCVLGSKDNIAGCLCRRLGRGCI